jgi:hypothetical protein
MHGSHTLPPWGRCSSLGRPSGWRAYAGKTLLLLCFLLLLLALVACDDASSGGATSAASASPTTPQLQITPPPPVATVTFQMYTGSTFALHYPQNWVVRTAGTVMSLSDASGTYNLTVNVQPNAGGKVSASQLAETSLAGVKASLSHPQRVFIASTVTLAGTTWSQRAISGTTLTNGVQVEREVIILATNHPGHASGTLGVVLVYMGVKQTFAQARKTYFAPILQSFAFV